ncbi:GAF and ANTAR domain-containing protein [Cellulomonas fimi]|uniref:ANTAR domain protein n=1 Tax=Cellulomonas fimi (strain ATCC 484 / DSM 20113 / JCM 1341 / CCUG 24087 / LMG 16345 / NBRC 15513 / NCIMB 8980 / NCTC 7547 / NRS-133) TaxID=590998 RepID=F4H3B5_CELFA|nr:GAF and ANTAR domain-containing protein [Cellulomonas fimi]AEE45336.1 ANTAR domain protein [Cellulomonas fimi ATCC 484]NNH08183.1 GAF and ANTAR domain-containing protein [Cellulomonas fimi]VEH29012.1 ANTAR domain [Cellulomonas fimi]
MTASETSAPGPGQAGRWFSADVRALDGAVRRAHAPGPPTDPQVRAAELQTARERLRAVDEELRAQHARIAELAAGVAEQATAASEEALRVAAAVSTLARLPIAGASVADLVPAVAAAVGEVFGDDCAISLVLGPPHEPTAVASTGETASAADGQQVWTGEGPSVDAYATRLPVVSADLGQDGRWPRFAERVAGVSGVVAVPVECQGDVAGVLTCYGRTPVRLTTAQIERAVHLGGTCSALLTAATEQVRLRDESEQLARALTSRSVIDEAKGVVIAQTGGTADEAFAHLAALSQQRNVKLREVAREIVDAAAGPVRAPRRRA